MDPEWAQLEFGSPCSSELDVDLQSPLWSLSGSWDSFLDLESACWADCDELEQVGKGMTSVMEADNIGQFNDEVPILEVGDEVEKPQKGLLSPRAGSQLWQHQDSLPHLRTGDELQQHREGLQPLLMGDKREQYGVNWIEQHNGMVLKQHSHSLPPLQLDDRVRQRGGGLPPLHVDNNCSSPHPGCSTSDEGDAAEGDQEECLGQERMLRFLHEARHMIESLTISSSEEDACSQPLPGPGCGEQETGGSNSTVQARVSSESDESRMRFLHVTKAEKPQQRGGCAVPTTVPAASRPCSTTEILPSATKGTPELKESSETESLLLQARSKVKSQEDKEDRMRQLPNPEYRSVHLEPLRDSGMWHSFRLEHCEQKGRWNCLKEEEPEDGKMNRMLRWTVEGNDIQKILHTQPPTDNGEDQRPSLVAQDGNLVLKGHSSGPSMDNEMNSRLNLQALDVNVIHKGLSLTLAEDEKKYLHRKTPSEKEMKKVPSREALEGTMHRDNRLEPPKNDEPNKCASVGHCGTFKRKHGLRPDPPFGEPLKDSIAYEILQLKHFASLQRSMNKDVPTGPILEPLIHHDGHQVSSVDISGANPLHSGPRGDMLTDTMNKTVSQETYAGEQMHKPKSLEPTENNGKNKILCLQALKEDKRLKALSLKHYKQNKRQRNPGLDPLEGNEVHRTFQLVPSADRELPKVLCPERPNGGTCLGDLTPMAHKAACITDNSNNPNRCQMIPNDSSPATSLLSDLCTADHLLDHASLKRTLVPIMKMIIGHRLACLFMKPVSERQAPDYKDIVKRPMDLATIQRTLTKGGIHSTGVFQRDVLLVFQNAVMYNSSELAIYHMAMAMQRDIIEMLQVLTERLNSSSKTSAE